MPKKTIVSPRQIIKCINIARQYPKYYLPLLEQQINSFQNETEYRINLETICETNEGNDAWLKAKKFLENQKPLAPLMELEGLSRAAESHAMDLEKMDQITHSGSDGSNFVDRIMKFCEKSEGALVEIIGNDFDIEERNHAEMIVLGLIIDDGVTSRGHRNSIFNPEYKYIGCGVGSLSGKIVGVINMSQAKLKEKPYQGNVSTSTTNLGQSKMSKVPTCMQDIEEENLSYSRTSQKSRLHQNQSSILSQKSHKSQKVWTFTKVESESKKVVYENEIPTCHQKIHQKQNKDSKVSINRNRNENKFGYETKQKIPSKQSIQDSQISQSRTKKYEESGSNLKQSNVKSSRVDPQNRTGYGQFVGQDISNKSTFHATFKDSMKSQDSSGFKKIKEKKETSRVWQEGEFKFEEKTTAIRYTDGTEQEFKEKTSLLLNDDPNV